MLLGDERIARFLLPLRGVIVITSKDTILYPRRRFDNFSPLLLFFAK